MAQVFVLNERAMILMGFACFLQVHIDLLQTYEYLVAGDSVLILKGRGAECTRGFATEDPSSSHISSTPALVAPDRLNTKKSIQLL